MVTDYSITILLLEDDEDDYLLTMESAKDGRLAARVYRVKNGLEGLAYLEGGKGTANGPGGDEIPFRECPIPDLLLVDLEMPKMDGREFMAKVKQEERWRRIPAVVLTNSRDERDVLESYDIGAAAYIVKPLNLAEMAAVVKQIRDFYLTIVRLPRRGD